MLDAIADFWKPVKRLQAQAKLKTEELQVGSVLVFGFVPQPSLSGRRFTVTAINTYKFGHDILTSFVLSQDKDAGASMIIAENNGEQYIAVSRRLSAIDRNKIFSQEDIDTVLSFSEAKNIHSKEVPNEYKGWIAPSYKREMHGVKGQLFKGDHRAGLISGPTSMDFDYTLMVSDNNEHALEIERHAEGRIEIYATVYRRMSDVGEVSHPEAPVAAAPKAIPKAAPKEVVRPDVKLVSNGATPHFTAPAKPEPKLGESISPVIPEKKMVMEAKAPEVAAPIVEMKAPDVQQAAITAPIKLPEFPAEAVAKKEVEAPVAQAPKVQAPIAATAVAQAEEKPATAAIIKSESQPYIKQEIKAMTTELSNFVNESIDCELHVANKIIDEAIRQEMRINDVVRRVIGLPVSQQESVQIPVTLTDQDYSLLAIRYGISSSDKESIKKRIIEDLGEFSGANKTKKAA